ncbi:MAG: chromate transporter [Bacillota bacterium]
MLLNIWYLFLAMARVGILGYGGGPSSIPLVKIEVVDNFRWMTAEEFANVLAMGNALPGPIATKMAGYVGYKVAGILGATAGVLGMVLPSLLGMLLLFRLMHEFREVPAVSGMVNAIRPVVIVLLAMLILDLWPKSVTGPLSIGVGVAAFVLMKYLNVHPALVVVGALGFGAFFMR